MKIGVRESLITDLDKMADYFLDADEKFLAGMGADKSKLPSRKSWLERLYAELEKPYTQKEYYYTIWLIDGEPIGHSNMNKISFGEVANMHLHIWNNAKRQRGLGINFLRLTIPIFFEKFALKQLICEPYSKNIAPNRTLEKLGFELLETYHTIPGPINFPQEVNKYLLTHDRFKQLWQL